jgi:hypothetical protein
LWFKKAMACTKDCENAADIIVLELDGILHQCSLEAVAG